MKKKLRYFMFFFRGRDKRAYIAALRKAKIYPPRQAAAIHESIRDLEDCGSCKIYMAAMHEPPQSTRWIVVQLVDCGSWIAAPPQ